LRLGDDAGQPVHTLEGLKPKAVVAGHKVLDSEDDPANIERT
jgi:hypothetical protein